jgi:hypothetical protein
MHKPDDEARSNGEEDLSESDAAALHAEASEAAHPGTLGQNEASTGPDDLRSAIERELAAGAVASATLIAKRAQGGDIAAAKMVLERLAPVDRDRRVSLALRSIVNAEDAVGALSDVLRATSEGKITLGDARILASLITKFLDATKDLEVDERLTAIEALLPELDEKAQSASARLRAIERYMRENPDFANEPDLIFMADDFAVLLFRGRRWTYKRPPEESIEAFLARVLAAAAEQCHGLKVTPTTYQEFTQRHRAQGD